jgi:hypothetical protein
VAEVLNFLPIPVRVAWQEGMGAQKELREEFYV